MIISKLIKYMKDEKLQIGIEEIKKVTMTTDEKRHIFENVLNFSAPINKPVRSTWTIYSLISRFHKNNLVFYSVISCFIILTSGGIVFASTESLPDSILYPIKVDIVEPIVSALTFSQEDKAQYESNLSTTRLVEAETLADKGKLNSSAEKRINTLLANHTIALNNALGKIDKAKSSEKMNEIVTNYNARMNAHAQVLDIMTAQGDTQDKAISNNQISKTVRVNAGKVISTLENKEENTTSKYLNKKKDVQDIIDSTSNDLGSAKINKSHIRQTIVNDTNKKLDQAKQFLSEVNINEKNGNSKDAYLYLVNSEVSAKEANIFLKAGLKFNNNSK